MKKLFVEPDIEILKFLCNVDVGGSPDTEVIPGEGEGESGGTAPFPGFK